MRMGSWLSVNKVRVKEYIAFKCLECGMISLFPSSHPDGNSCIKCRGYLAPIGKAMVDNRYNSKGIDLNLNIDTSQLDEALEKAKELKKITNKINDFGREETPPIKKCSGGC